MLVFTGLQAFGDYLAEDYFLGSSMLERCIHIKNMILCMSDVSVFNVCIEAGSLP